MFSSLRTRLTLWYVAALTVVLVLFSLGVFFFAARAFNERINTRLLSTLQVASYAITHAASVGDGTAVARGLEDPAYPSQLVALFDLQGHLLIKRPLNSPWPLRVPRFPPQVSELPTFYDLEESAEDRDDSVRGVYKQVADSSERRYVLLVTQSSESLSDHLDALQNRLLAAVIAALLLSCFGGWVLAGRSLAPVHAMAEAAEHINSQNLEQRLPVRNPSDELGRLAASFNCLLSRLAQAFSQQKQFMADASHQLRTPVSVIRTAAQVSLQKTHRAEPDYREALAIIEQQAARLTALVQNMFELTRADMGQLPLEMKPFYLDELLADAVRTAAVLAHNKGVQLEAQEMREAPYYGDESLLRQMISNLLDNAIKYTPEGGRVRLNLCRRSGAYTITISDTGIGIAPEIQSRIFERFFRGEQARQRQDGAEGAGLGLSIAQLIAQMHDGDLTLESSGPEGSTFRVTLAYESAESGAQVVSRISQKI